MAGKGNPAATHTADAAAKTKQADGAATDTLAKRAESAASGALNAQQSTAAKAGGKKAGKATDDIPGFFVRAVPETGFRLCGFAFTREGIGIALDVLSEEQAKVLKEEKNLVVEEVTFPLDETAG